MSVVGLLHDRLVFGRRIRLLAKHLAREVPADAQVLDVGCGDGTLAARLMELRPDLTIEGVDVIIRPKTAISVRQFDGKVIEGTDGSVDTVMMIDVLHHTEDPAVLLAEALRVARRAVIIKDHLSDGLGADATLRFMDWVGNARHGVALPYNYWPERRWRETLARLDARIETWNSRLGLYSFPASVVFDRSLHFVARVSPERRNG